MTFEFKPNQDQRQNQQQEPLQAPEAAVSGNVHNPPLLSIPNLHDTHAPVVFASNPDVYVGYFENCYGEQWVFTYDRRTNKAVVTGGDVSWKEYPVHSGGYADLVLNREECAWLEACWHSAVLLRGHADRK